MTYQWTSGESVTPQEPLQRLQSRKHRVPEIAYAGTQSRTHEEKTLRRFQIMRNQVDMDTGGLTDGVWAPWGSVLAHAHCTEEQDSIRTDVLPVLDYA